MLMSAMVFAFGFKISTWLPCSPSGGSTIDEHSYVVGIKTGDSDMGIRFMNLLTPSWQSILLVCHLLS